MFDLNFSKIDRQTFDMRYVAMTNLFAAWYMLSSLKSELPNIDLTLAKIYFTEYGINIEGLKDSEIINLAKEYRHKIREFFIRCEIQRCENIIDRFGKVGCDPRVNHQITLPLQCKEFFLEIIQLANNRKFENSLTKETQCLDSLLSTMIVNNTYDVDFMKNGHGRVHLNEGYTITTEQFSSYTDIVHSAVLNLYRPLSALDETHEDWGTKFRKVIDYIKTLVFIATRDAAYRTDSIWPAYEEDNNIVNAALSAPLMEFGTKDELYVQAAKMLPYAYRGTGKIRDAIEATVAPYSTLNIEHAICLFHNTNASLDTSKLPQSKNTDTFKFLCCQEFIASLDQKIKSEMLQSASGSDPRVG